MAVRGRFITLEGIEGVGKTTNRQVVEAQLTEASIEFITTREPGGTPLGESLRELVLHGKGQMRHETELLMMMASRLEHVDQVIEPALAAGRWVVCDRFLDASVAYQGGGRQLGVERVQRLHKALGMVLEPDLTLLLDMPVEASLARMAARGKPDRIEKEKLAFFQRARETYLTLARTYPNRVTVIDASRALPIVNADVVKALDALIAPCYS